MSHYKVSINAAPHWKTYSLCCLDISIGNEKETGEKFAASVDWINRNFSFCILNLGDALSRHNMRTSLYAPEEALAKSQEHGDLWLAENREAINNFTIPCIITRWDEWLEHRDFEKVHAHLWAEYMRDHGLRDAVDNDLVSFIERNKHRGWTFGRKDVDSCTNYILEEMAVYIVMSREFRLARIYPATRLETAAYLAENNRSLYAETYIQLNFKKKKSATPDTMAA